MMLDPRDKDNDGFIELEPKCMSLGVNTVWSSSIYNMYIYFSELDNIVVLQNEAKI